MKLGVLFSGGKDSVYACRRAMEKNEVACLITLVSENLDSYMFHTPNIRHAKMQAEALGIPQLARPTRGEKEAELADLEAAISEAKERFGLQGIVTERSSPSIRRPGCRGSAAPRTCGASIPSGR